MLLTEDYLSILFDGTSQYGKVNRNTMVLNIDLLTGEKLEIEDFFLSDVDASNLVMDYCKTDLTSQYEEYYVERIGEQFSMLIDWGCTKQTCSNVSLTNDGFYLIFDDLFSRAEGRWVVHAPYSAFGDSCLLNEFKDAYGFFSVPVGWSYIYNERNLLSNFIIKFPAIKDENGYVINARMLNDTDTLIELPLELPEKLRSGEKNPYVNSYVLIQRNTIHYDSSLDGIGTEISAPFAPTQSCMP